MRCHVCIAVTTCNGELVVVDVVTDGMQLLLEDASQECRV